MPIYARVKDGEVREINEFDYIEGRFHPSMKWIEIDSNLGIEVGWLYQNGQFSLPESDTEDNIPDLEPNYEDFLLDLDFRISRVELGLN